MCEVCTPPQTVDDLGTIEGVTWWDGTGVTISALYDAVEALAVGQPTTTAMCSYSMNGVPVCIIGQAVFNITGKVVSDTLHGGSLRYTSEWHRILGSGSGPDYWVEGSEEDSRKMRILVRVQGNQDSNLPWGKAWQDALYVESER